MTGVQLKQFDLEQEMLKMGQERYQAKVSRAKEMNLESTHPAGQKLLQHSVVSLTDHFKKWIDHATTSSGKRHTALPYLNQVPCKVSAALTARATLDAISNGRKLIATAANIGGLIEDEVKYQTLKDDYAALWQQLNRAMDRYKSAYTKKKFIEKSLRHHDIVIPRWSAQERIKVGLVCLELMRQSTGLIDINTRKNQHGKAEQWVEPSADLIEWLKNAHAHMEMLDPVFLPMVERPVPWQDSIVGGYSSGVFRRRPLVKTKDKGHLELVNGANMPKVYRAINAIQGTPFKVNTAVLEVMQHCWNKNIAVDGLVTAEDAPLPAKPVDIDTNKDARREWRRRAARQHFENERQRSKRLHAMRVMSLAEKFKAETIYYPSDCDFRGRVYPMPYFLQPQGPSFARSLLSFDRTTVMTDIGEQWLRIHIANCWGMDKNSYNQRIQWTHENSGMLHAIGLDPIGNMDWTQADDPWRFLAACIEYAGMMKGGQFHTSLPIGIDATNQGLQIYALALRDQTSAQATNCLPCELPNDIYQQVCDTVLDMIATDTHEYAKGWREFGLSRKTTKRQTMTLPYGSSFFSCKKYTAEWFYDELKKGKTNPFGDQTYQPCGWLAEKIWDAIGQVVHAARIGMDWLQHVAETCLDNGVTPQWVTPLGFPVYMHYEKQDHLNIKTNVFGVIRQTRIRTDNGDPSKRKSMNAMAPNFVHSIDGIGGLLGETTNRAMDQGVTDFLMVHDEYSVHAPCVPIVGNAVRDATVDLFSGNILKDLHTQINTLLPSGVQLDEPPPQGNLDISLINKAQYYFS